MVKLRYGSSPDEQEAIWRESLMQGHAPLKGLRKLMHLLPGSPRCKICHNPFGGFGGHVCRAVGFKPSRKNPLLCTLCCEALPPGGAEIEIAILFADVRGSSALAEKLGPAEFAATLNRFYRVATDALMRHEATIDKLIGDEVMAFFVPGFAGPEFKRAAVEAARTLMRGLGYGTAGGPWLPVGVGIDAGIAYVGNVGGEGYLDFTALGDPVNTASRIQEAARPGEILIGETAFAAVADRYPHCPPRRVEARGKEEGLAVRSLPLAA